VYGFASYAKRFGRAGTTPCCDAPYPVGGLSRSAHRCQCPGLCPVAPAAHQCTDPLGAGSFVAQRGRAPCAGGYRGRSSCDHGGSVPRRRRALGNGGWIALSQLGRCYWRGVGRSARARFYGNQEAGASYRSGKCVLLADPQGRQPRSERCARSVAYRQPAICATPVRPPGTWCATLVARSVPVAPVQTGAMDRDL